MQNCCSRLKVCKIITKC